jgi:hypothetical protein
VRAAKAAAMAVLCASATERVGVGSGPQADNIKITRIEIIDINILFIFSPL